MYHVSYKHSNILQPVPKVQRNILLKPVSFYRMNSYQRTLSALLLLYHLCNTIVY